MSGIATRGEQLHGDAETAAATLSSDFTIFAQFLQSAATIASASTITLPNFREYFRVTGTTTISAISSTNMQAGKSIYLMFTSQLILRHNVTPPGSAFKFLLAAGQDITVGGAGSPLVLEFKFDSVAVAMVQVGGDASSGIAAGVFGSSNHYIASLTVNAHGSVTAVLVRNLADNKSNSNTGNIVMTQAAPSGPFTNDRLRLDAGEGLIVQDRIQGYYDLTGGGITTSGNGLVMPHANEGALVLGTGGAFNVDGIQYTNWEYGTVLTIRIFANVNAVTIRHLASPPLNSRAFYLSGEVDIVIPAGKSRTLAFMLDQQTGPVGGNPVWAQVGEPPGTGGGGGVASVTAGTGISITGTGTNPIVNNGGVLSVTAGAGLVDIGFGAFPNLRMRWLGHLQLGGLMTNTGSTRRWWFGGIHAAITGTLEWNIDRFLAAGATVMDIDGFVPFWSGPNGDVSLSANGSVVSGTTLTLGVGNIGGTVGLTGIAIPGGASRIGLTVLPSGSADSQVQYTVSFR